MISIIVNHVWRVKQAIHGNPSPVMNKCKNTNLIGQRGEKHRQSKAGSSNHH